MVTLCNATLFQELKGCYTVQHFFQLDAIVLMLSRDWKLHTNSKVLLAAQQILWEELQEVCYTVHWPKNALQCWLQQSLRIVEPDATSCNAFCNKNAVQLYDCEACYILQFCLQLVLQQNCVTSCKCNSAFHNYQNLNKWLIWTWMRKIHHPWYKNWFHNIILILLNYVSVWL